MSRGVQVTATQAADRFLGEPAGNSPVPPCYPGSYILPRLITLVPLAAIVHACTQEPSLETCFEFYTLADTAWRFGSTSQVLRNVYRGIGQ